MSSNNPYSNSKLINYNKKRILESHDSSITFHLENEKTHNYKKMEKAHNYINISQEKKKEIIKKFGLLLGLILGIFP
jgi:hypothetical protein